MGTMFDKDIVINVISYSGRAFIANGNVLSDFLGFVFVWFFFHSVERR